MSSLYSLRGPHSSTTTTGPHRQVDGHPRITPATFRLPISGQPPQDHIGNFQAPHIRRWAHSFPFPGLPSSILVLIGVSTVSWSLCQLLGFTPQGRQTCACPASRLKKEPGVGNRDISGLMNGGTYMSEAGSWSNTPLSADSRQ